MGATSSKVIYLWPFAYPPRIDLQSLPDLTHEAVSSFLTNKDINHLVEAGPSLMVPYRDGFKMVTLRRLQGRTDEEAESAVASMLSRRPGLLCIDVMNWGVVRGLVKAMREHHCSKVQTFHFYIPIVARDAGVPEQALLGSFFKALSCGACPELDNLLLRFDEEIVENLQRILARAPQCWNKRKYLSCKQLKSLTVELINVTLLASLSPLITWGAFDDLQSLVLKGYSQINDTSAGALSQWLMRTTAPQLKHLTLQVSPLVIAEALSTINVASNLEYLCLGAIDAEGLELVVGAIAAGAWINLLHLSMYPGEMVDGIVPRMMEAIHHGGPRMKTFGLGGPHIKRSTMTAMTGAFEEGFTCRLEGLCLLASRVGDGGVLALMMGLGRLGPCHKTLTYLDLSRCGVGPLGVRELVRYINWGAVPNLKQLNLNENELKDAGVVQISYVMEAGAMPHLQILELRGVKMVGEVGIKALFGALGRPYNPCPRLERLDVRKNDLSVRGMRKLVRGLWKEERGPKKLKVDMNGRKTGKEIVIAV